MRFILVRIFVLIISNVGFIYSAKKIKENCATCKEIVENFKKGLDDTAKNHFAGGDTAWEESRLGSYATSETRLLDILERVCKKAKKESRCDALVEEYEESIEEFWNKKTDISLFEKYLCVDTMKVCCPDGTYGKSCKACPKHNEKICSGKGKCEGSGTRSGNGECECDEGYDGDLCEDCDDGYYRDDTSGNCTKCHESCSDDCTDGTSKGCGACADGYTHDEENGCIDKDECAEDPNICGQGKFCFNTKGSHRCHACDPACKTGCTNSGRLSCIDCVDAGWKEIEGGKGCEDINECAEQDVNPCAIGTYCENTEGTFICKACHKACASGCTGPNPGQCDECAEGYHMSDENECVDVDQCVEKNISCNTGYVCVNKDGPDSCEACHSSCLHCISEKEEGCIACHPGYALIDGKCKDFNECNNNPCQKNEKCVNSPGSYKCLCKTDYVRTKKGDCKKKKGKTKKESPSDDKEKEEL